MKYQLRIRRFERGKDSEPYWSEYEIEGEPTDRLLDALHTIKWHQEGTLAFRRSCGHGICGSDAMLVNGVNRLACKVLLRDLGRRITVEPMRGFPVLKDLVVDMDAFFRKYKSIKPYLMPNEEAPTTERLQSPEDRERCAFSAAPAPPHARRSGTTTITWARRPSCRRTASCSTAVMRLARSDWRRSGRATASGAAAPSTTAPTPARETSG
jgi:hypothetical protein